MKQSNEDKQSKTAPTQDGNKNVITAKPSNRYGVDNGKCAWCGADATDLPIEHFKAHDKSIGTDGEFSSRQLLDALYWVWDIFDRGMVKFFLVHKTAEDMLQKKQLSGDGIYAGMRKVDWESGAKRIILPFATPDEETEDEVKYVYKGIPIYIHLYPEDECLKNIDTVFYEREYFHIPNPYKRFMEVFGK